MKIVKTKMEKAVRNSYSQEDIKTIKMYVQRYPSNLTVAFEKAAEALGRSSKSVTQKYYTSIRSKEMIFALSSDKSTSINGKNKPRKTDRSEKLDLVSVLFSKLSTSEKIQIIKENF